LVAEFAICKIRTVKYLWISYIHNNHSLLLNAPVISQHVFTSRHWILILCITHRLLLFITSSAVCVIAWPCDLTRGNTYGLPSSKFRIIVETLGATYGPETYVSIRLNACTVIQAMSRAFWPCVKPGFALGIHDPSNGDSLFSSP